MADKKTTSNSGIFGQSLGGDLDLSQFSGPKLFTPAPLPPAPTIPQTLHQQSHVSNSPLPAPNTPIPPPSQYHTPLQTPNMSSNFNPAAPQPQRLPPLPTTTPPKQFDATQVLRQTPRPNMTPVPLTQGLDNVPLQSPPINATPFGGTNHPPAPMIPTFTPSNQTNQFLTGPMIPPSNTPAQVFNPTMSPSTYNPTVFTPNQPPKAPTMFVPPSNPEPSANNYYSPSQTMNQAPAMSGYQQQHASPTEYNISPFASMNTQQNLMHSVPKVTPHWFYLRTWTIHLPFYKKMTEWQVFSKADSHKLEHEYLLHRGTKNGGSVVVQTDGGRYDVDLNDMTRNSVYWKEEPSTVRRCTWFYKEENQFLPYETEPAEKLEEEYLSMMSKGIFNIRVDISQNDFVLFHNPDTMVQYSNNQDLQWTGEDAKTRPKIVRRGIADEVYQQIHQGEEGSIEHVVFVIHGIGPVADLRGRTIVECVDDLRRHSLHFTNNNGFTIQGRPANRVEFFPIQWYSSIRDEKFGIDKQLEQLSLPSISKLRHFTNETLTDILFFTSPLYCQTIVDTVITEMNRIYKLFKSRNPTYNGTTSVCGHSLGSVIAFDILANQGKQKNQQQVNGHQQPSTYENSGEIVEDTILRGSSGPPSRNSSAPPSLDTSMSDLSLDDVTNMHDLLAKLNLLSLEQQFEDEQIDLDTLMMCQDGDLKDLGVPFGPRKKLVAYMKNKDNPQPTALTQNNSSAPTNNTTLLTRGTNTANSNDQSDLSLKSAGSGTGQPVVTYKALDFQTDSLFALGSPIGLFLTTRGVTTLGLEYRLPFCNSFMNIFHPYDPVVYRLEPLVNEMIDIPPVLIPHHKGRKRFHLEIKDNITRVSAKVKSGIMDAVNRTWTSINDFARSHQPDYQPANEDSLSAVGENEALDTTSTEEEMALKARENALDFGRLNSGKRVDFALQEKPFEILNEYLFALGSHTCYWTSEDVALLMLKQIYKINE